MSRPTSPLLRFSLVLAGLLALACGGGGGSAGDPGTVEFAKQPAPEPEPETAPDGLGAELGLPLGNGMVKTNDDRNVEILHISAFEAGKQWEAYKAHLEADGWTWRKTPVPPFDGVFEKDRTRLRLTCELAGTSVWVKAKRM